MPNDTTDRPTGGTTASTAGLPTPHIGAFVLETLTLGMYGEPRHTLREYVQNAFDSIRAAQRAKRLAGRGRVDVTLDDDAITIRDNGLGVRADEAWTTLLSVGASKKDRERDVGFRGIGRLAGMAYCDTLAFRTTFQGETAVTTITFDCRALLQAMDPDESGDLGLADLLARTTTFAREPNGAEADAHFFEVTLRGLAAAPAVLREPTAVQNYLSETVPVPFAADWSHRAAVETGYQRYFGAALEEIDVYVHAGGRADPVFKPYGDTYRIGRTASSLARVEYVSDPANRYWGWIGHLSGSGAVTDPHTKGLRVRVRNIQVDHTAIIASIFADYVTSYARFATWYVGEIHLAPDQVVPNARRDGFEETREWAEIKENLRVLVCGPLAREAYRKSRDRQFDVNKLVSDIAAATTQVHALANDPGATFDAVVELLNSAKSQRLKAAAALKLVDDVEDVEADPPEPALGEDSPPPPAAQRLRAAARDVEAVEATARTLIGQFVDDDARTEGLRERLRQEVVKEVLDIVRGYVDQATYLQVRKQLMRRG